MSAGTSEALAAEMLADAQRDQRRASNAHAAAFYEAASQADLEGRLDDLRPDRYREDDLSWALPAIREVMAAAEVAAPDYEERVAELVKAEVALMAAEHLAELVRDGRALAERDDAGRIQVRMVKP